MALCNMRTENGDNGKPATLEDIQLEIQTLDNPQRGDSFRNGAFITIWFEQNGTDDEFMQCMPVYPKQSFFLKKLFRKQDEGHKITDYIVEVGRSEKIHAKQVHGKDELSQILTTYFTTHTLPDTSDWEDTGLL